MSDKERESFHRKVLVVIGCVKLISLTLLSDLNEAIQRCLSMAASAEDFQQFEVLYAQIPPHFRSQSSY